MKLAKELGDVPILDSGKWYRTLAYLANECQIDVKDQAAVTELTSKVRFIPSSDPDHFVRFVLEGSSGPSERNLAVEELEDPDIGQGASVIGQYPAVRKMLADMQRESGHKGVVTAGRVQGTEVFDPAFEQLVGQPVIRVFLYASPEDRASRRFIQMHGRKPENLEELEPVLDDIKSRDLRDSDGSKRPFPLLSKEDAEKRGFLVIDTGLFSQDEVIGLIKSELRRRCPELFVTALVHLHPTDA
jgi:cytidylate kinase